MGPRPAGHRLANDNCADEVRDQPADAHGPVADQREQRLPPGGNGASLTGGWGPFPVTTSLLASREAARQAWPARTDY
jgi:hypothetical protein